MKVLTLDRPQMFRAVAVLSALVPLVGVFALPAASADAAAATIDTSTFAARVEQLTNAERANVGLAPLRTNASLGVAAQSYAVVLSQGGCFAHTCLPQPDLAQRLESAGYTFSGYDSWSWGENIAAGYQTPESVVAGWMTSPGHRENMLSSRYDELGVGLVARPGSSPDSLYWVQDFGARSR